MDAATQPNNHFAHNVCTDHNHTDHAVPHSTDSRAHTGAHNVPNRDTHNHAHNCTHIRSTDGSHVGCALPTHVFTRYLHPDNAQFYNFCAHAMDTATQSHNHRTHHFCTDHDCPHHVDSHVCCSDDPDYGAHAHANRVSNVVTLGHTDSVANRTHHGHADASTSDVRADDVCPYFVCTHDSARSASANNNSTHHACTHRGCSHHRVTVSCADGHANVTDCSTHCCPHGRTNHGSNHDGSDGISNVHADSVANSSAHQCTIRKANLRADNVSTHHVRSCDIRAHFWRFSANSYVTCANHTSPHQSCTYVGCSEHCSSFHRVALEHPNKRPATHRHNNCDLHHDAKPHAWNHHGQRVLLRQR